jgi:hypothetical protein
LRPFFFLLLVFIAIKAPQSSSLTASYKCWSTSTHTHPSPWKRWVPRAFCGHLIPQLFFLSFLIPYCFSKLLSTAWGCHEAKYLPINVSKHAVGKNAFFVPRQLKSGQRRPALQVGSSSGPSTGHLMTILWGAGFEVMPTHGSPCLLTSSFSP